MGCLDWGQGGGRGEGVCYQLLEARIAADHLIMPRAPPNREVSHPRCPWTEGEKSALGVSLAVVGDRVP